MGEAGRTRDSLAHWEKHEERDLDEAGATPGDLLLILRSMSRHSIVIVVSGYCFFPFLFVRFA